MDTPEISISPLQTSHSEDFESKYANHVQFELSAWDLKLVFGQLEQTLGPNSVLQHTAITLPWPQVKIMAYLLHINLLVQESLMGRIPVPGGIIPNPDAIKAGADLFRNSPEIHRLMLEAYNTFIKENPEAASEGFRAKPKTRK